MPPGGDDEEGGGVLLPFKGKRSEEAQAAREKLCVQLRLTGLSYAEIGRQTGYSEGHVYKIVAQAITLPPEERAAARNLDLARLDRLQAALWPLAIGGKMRETITAEDGTKSSVEVDAPSSVMLAASKQALAIISKRIDLLGTAAPVKVEVTPPPQEITQIVQQILEATGTAPEVLDADIVEADVLDGDGPEPEQPSEPAERDPLDDDYEW